MISLLIIAHVVLLCASLIVTTGSAVTAAAGVAVPKLVNILNLAGTSTGLLFGVILLLNKPLDMRCVMLTAYVAAFALAQVYIRRRNNQLATNSI